jgi:ATP-dependent Clp protease ATP-binding subunit ClpA
MALDEAIVAEVRELRIRLLELQRDLEHTQADYQHAIRRLQAEGGSMREIAAELGLSHQRVHQIVGAQVRDRSTRHHRGLITRFTREARRVVEAAVEEARALGHSRVGTEHLLLAAAAVDPSGSATALADAGATRERLRDAAVAALGESAGSRRGHIPFTRAAKRALESSLAEAARSGSRRIQSEHVLLGLLATERGGALDLLAELGVDREALRASTLALLERT